MPNWFIRLIGLCCFCVPSSSEQIHQIGGHRYQSQRMKTNVLCMQCGHRCRRKGYVCQNCGVVVHKRCRALVTHCKEDENSVPMPEDQHASVPPSSLNSSKQVHVHEMKRSENVKDPPAASSTPINEEELNCVFYSAVEDHGHDDQKLNEDVKDPPIGSVIHINEEDGNISASEDNLARDSDQKGKKDLKSLQDFSIIDKLGEGSYGKVFLVSSKDNSRYAMKVVNKKEAFQSISSVYTEKKILHLARDCPFLISLRCCFQTNSSLCYIMEYASGGDLNVFLKWYNRLPEDFVRFFGAELAIAINFLHEKKVIHRDLKLENILLNGDGHIKVTDFGLSKEGIGPYERTKTLCGTPQYTAPEIFKGEEYGSSIDWWSFGIILFRLVAGTFPFFAQDILSIMRAVKEEPVILPDFFSPEISSLLLGLLQKCPEKRLGGNPQSGFRDIKQHSFFSSTDWDRLENKEIPPPFQPHFGQQILPPPGSIQWVEDEDFNHPHYQQLFENFDCVI
ncbi:protein kinase C zeta type-like [Rhinophrynus dorsalis]